MKLLLFPENWYEPCGCPSGPGASRTPRARPLGLLRPLMSQVVYFPLRGYKAIGTGIFTCVSEGQTSFVRLVGGHNTSPNYVVRF